MYVCIYVMTEIKPQRKDAYILSILTKPRDWPSIEGSKQW